RRLQCDSPGEKAYCFLWKAPWGLIFDQKGGPGHFSRWSAPQMLKIVKTKRAARSGGAVQLPGEIGVANNILNIFARFGKRNRFHKLLRIAIFALLQPILHAI